MSLENIPILFKKNASLSKTLYFPIGDLCFSIHTPWLLHALALGVYPWQLPWPWLLTHRGYLGLNYLLHALALAACPWATALALATYPYIYMCVCVCVCVC